MDVGTIATVALIAGLAGGAIAAAMVGTVEGMLRQRYSRPTISGGGMGRHVTQPTVVGREWLRHPPPVAHPAQVGLPGAGPFDDFTDRAKRVLALSQDEAVRMAHDYMGTEHLLCGLIREGEGIAAQVLSSLGVELDKARKAMEFSVGRGSTQGDPGQVTLSPEIKSALASARDEARKLGHGAVGTEHMLMGVCRESGKGVGILQSLGVRTETVRAQVIASLNRPPPPPASGGPLPI